MARGRGRPKKKVVSPLSTTLELDRKTETSSTSRSESNEEPHGILEGKTIEVKVMKVTQPSLKPVEESPKKLWVDVISGNRTPENGLPIEFSAPNLVDGELQGEIEEDDVFDEKCDWEAALIMYAIGKDLSMHTVKQFMERMWNFVQLPLMYYHDEGYFILKFKDIEDRDKVLMKGSYTIHNVSMILKEWDSEFDFKRDSLRTLPIWIKLPQLPLHLWGAMSLGKIGSAFGKPLFTDECTANKLRVSYARILVEVDITQKHQDSIKIKDSNGRMIEQNIEMEWKPKYCEICQRSGHQCTKDDGKKQWKAKVKVPIPTLEAENVAEPPKQAIEGNNVWTEVANSRKHKGKSPEGPLLEKSSEVNCHNGFDSLRDVPGSSNPFGE
ncbi:uncharacterized protein LOC131650983 [Vicia villosa]|uniref:uncharacterized protein LOC131650983 n=1 Tax=Vicia villosa TaxID=3911 RepID=UPI00273BBC4C|nr:uncharacterized protein LOC131650983 [Vicia villosa]